MLSYFSIACRCPECAASEKPFVTGWSQDSGETARTLQWLLTCPHQRSLPLAIMALMLGVNARADQPVLASADPTTLASDLSLHGPTIDTRPLDAAPATGKVNSPDSNLSMQTSAAVVPADALPQDNTLASNQTPDLNTPGSIAQQMPPVVPSPSATVVTDGPIAPAPSLVSSTDLAANTAAPSVPSKTSATPAPAPAATTKIESAFTIVPK